MTTSIMDSHFHVDGKMDDETKEQLLKFFDKIKQEIIDDKISSLGWTKYREITLDYKVGQKEPSGYYKGSTLFNFHFKYAHKTTYHKYDPSVYDKETEENKNEND